MKPLDVNAFKIGVVGAGSWGTALADLLAVKGFTIDHWVYEKEVKEQMAAERENKVFLPGHHLSENLVPSNRFEAVISDKDLVLVVTPSHVLRTIMSKGEGLLSDKTIVVSATKGIENRTHLTMSGVLKNVLPGLGDDRLAVITGPSFAKEVALRAPTAITVASKNNETARMVQTVFATSDFRVYTIKDVIGAELGAAVKNVIAIAAGVIDGLGLGLNTRAALITRGLTEIRRLGLAMGADPRTFTGLAGAGDLILTCTGDLSRNHTVGKQIGMGKNLQTLLSEMRMVAEGVKTAKSVYNLSRRLGGEMPICHSVYHVLYHDIDPQKALYQLMTRDLKEEFDDK